METSPTKYHQIYCGARGSAVEDFTRPVGQVEREMVKTCVVCVETLPATAFPEHLPSPLCAHAISTCTQCTRNGIAYAVEVAKQEAYGRKQYGITCPECPQIFSLDVAQLYMDNETFRKFEEATMRRVLALASETNTSQIAWCPFCPNHGQTFGPTQTVAICHSCEGLFCCRHAHLGLANAVPWHSEHTCEEYDQSHQDPTFRSLAQIKQAFQDDLYDQSQELRRQIELSAENWELSLTKKDDEAKLRKIEQARLERERREEAERLRVARQKREAERKAAREAEDRASADMVNQAYVRCPSCKAAVEKIDGCNHISCKCGKDWNYRTGGDWFGPGMEGRGDWLRDWLR